MIGRRVDTATNDIILEWVSELLPQDSEFRTSISFAGDYGYERIPYRVYSCKQLLEEVNAFLQSKYKTAIFPWEKVWHVFLREELGDWSKQYRPLRLRRKSVVDGATT